MRIEKRTVHTLLMFLMILFIGSVMPVEVEASEYNKAYVTISRYEIVGGAVIPGEEFELNVTLKNTSTQNNVGSTMITFASGDDMVHTVNGEPAQFYVDGLYVQQEVVVTLRLEAEEDLQTATTSLGFQIVYADQESYANQNQLQLSLPVSTAGYLSVKGYTVPDTAAVGIQTRISSNYKNTGLDSLSNIVLNITGTGLAEEVHYELTSLVGGDQNYAEVYVNFHESGKQDIEINFNYTDAQGNTYETEKQTYSVEVEEAGTEIQPQEDVRTGQESRIAVLVVRAVFLGASLILLLIALLLYRKDKK